MKLSLIIIAATVSGAITHVNAADGALEIYHYAEEQRQGGHVQCPPGLAGAAVGCNLEYDWYQQN